MNKDEALDLALEALLDLTAPSKRARAAITAIKKARSAPVQEPVGTYGEIHESMQALLRSGLQRDQYIYMAMKDKPLYTTQPAQPAYKDSTPHLHVGDSAFESWFSEYNPAGKGDKQRARDAYAAGMGDPLVAPAPQRQWVGLTDEEKRQIFEREDYQGWLDYINAIEAKLKERNV